MYFLSMIRHYLYCIYTTNSYILCLLFKFYLKNSPSIPICKTVAWPEHQEDCNVSNAALLHLATMGVED